MVPSTHPSKLRRLQPQRRGKSPPCDPFGFRTRSLQVQRRTVLTSTARCVKHGASNAVEGPVPALILLLLTLVTFLAGCATEPVGSCEYFEQVRGRMRYETVYRYSGADTRIATRNFVPAPKDQEVSVRWYTLRVNRAQIHPCDYLYLTKDLYLQRSNNREVTLHEQREFY